MDENELRIEIDPTPSPEDERVVWGGLRQHNYEQISTPGESHLTLFLRRADGTVAGGVLAKTNLGWLHTNVLWVDPGLRGQGHGTRLMAAVEAEARKRGCHSAYLDTFSFQARPFYEKCGYEVFGTLDNFPEGHQRFFMRKRLDD